MPLGTALSKRLRGSLHFRGRRALRTALLSTIERTSEGVPRAFLQLGGRPLLAWQAELARALDCTRLIILCDGASPEIIEVQRTAEAEGIRVHLIRGPLQLVGLVSADESLVVIADGLIPDRNRLVHLFGAGRGVATLPAEAGLAAGFERIDAANAWGGIFVVRGSVAEKLADMPPDSDTVSLLLRLALQAGTRTVALDTSWLHSGEWLLVRDEAEIGAREKALLDSHIAKPAWTGPGLALARFTARKLAPAGLQRGPIGFGALSLLSGVGAIAAAFYEQTPAALGLLAVSAFALQLAGFLSELKRSLFGEAKSRLTFDAGKSVFDLALIAAVVVPTTVAMLPYRMFVPLVMIGLVRLAARSTSKKWQDFWRDRILLATSLATGAALGGLVQTMAALCLFALAVLLFPRKPNALTTD